MLENYISQKRGERFQYPNSNYQKKDNSKHYAASKHLELVLFPKYMFQVPETSK